MPALSCSATTCIYNKQELCSKGDVKIGGTSARQAQETCCESFQERMKDSMSNSMNSSMASGCGCTNIAIDCEAKNCQFNESCRCTAGGVQISGSQACCCDDTRCSSFRCG